MSTPAEDNDIVNSASIRPLPNASLAKSIYPMSKTLLDYLITVPALLLLAPLFLLIALCIRLDSPGPIFSRRVVVGRNGRQFTAFHFRATHFRSETQITRMGRLLCRHGLNELPLLFNVLRREMSLIGPRLVSPAELASYDQYHPAILQAYPGLTGLWQISRCRKNRLQKELAYVQKWSIWLDLKILLLTVPAAINQP